MIAALKTRLASMGDAFLGRGEHAVTVPPMDGALQPNQALEEAACRLRLPQPDNLVSSEGRVYLTTGQALHAWTPGVALAEPLAVFDAAITSAAAFAGGVAVGTDDGRIHVVGGRRAGRDIAQLAGYRANCPTALLGLDDDRLVVAEGSSRLRCGGWRHSLMSGDRSGSVWLLDLEQSSGRGLANGLAWPSGLAPHPAGGLIVSEAWRHRLLRVGLAGGPIEVALADLPSYPGRLAPADGGGHWLCMFAPRSQLVEFVLREPKFLKRMMTEVPEGYWVAPALSSGRDFKEPLQGGAIKSMGILKPWAPTRSYGLVVRLDASLAPVSSLHSRADGRRHGVTSALEWQGELLIASRGGDAVLAVPLPR